MAINTETVFDAVKARVVALAGMQHVYEGVPESLGNQVVAYLTVGAQTMAGIRAGGHQTWEQRFRVTFGYRVAGAEPTAERKVAQFIDALRKSIMDDRKMGGAVDSAEVDLSLADGPEYESAAAQEFRRYPVVVVTRQSETITPS